MTQDNTLSDLGLVWREIDGEYFTTVHPEGGGAPVTLRISDGVLTANGKPVPGVHPVIERPAADDRRSETPQDATSTRASRQARLDEIAKDKAAIRREIKRMCGEVFTPRDELENKYRALGNLDDAEEKVRNEPRRLWGEAKERERMRRETDRRNHARGAVADRVRMELGKDVYVGRNHVWEYYEWGPGMTSCWFRTGDADCYADPGESIRYAVEICGDPRKRDPKDPDDGE